MHMSDWATCWPGLEENHTVFLNYCLQELASIGAHNVLSVNMIEGAAFFSLSASVNITLLTHTDRENTKVKEERVMTGNKIHDRNMRTVRGFKEQMDTY